MHSFSPDSLCLQALLWPKGEKVPRRAHVRLPSLVAEREALQELIFRRKSSSGLPREPWPREGTLSAISAEKRQTIGSTRDGSCGCRTR